MREAFAKDFQNGNDEEFKKFALVHGAERNYYNWLADYYAEETQTAGQSAQSKPVQTTEQKTKSDKTQEMSYNVKEKPAKAEKRGEVQARDSWDQAVLDDPDLGADILRAFNEAAEENARKRKIRKPKSTTPKVSKEEVEQKMSDNVEEKTAKAEEQDEVEVLDSWAQAVINNPLFGPDFFRITVENAPGNKKKTRNPKKATPKKSKEDVEVEVAVRNEEMQTEATQEGEGKDAIDAYIGKIADSKQRAAARRYFNEHPERRDFIKEVLEKNPQVRLKKNSTAKNNAYYLTYDGQGKTEKIVKVEAVIISKLSNTEIGEYVEEKKQTKAEKKAAEEAKYISEIPEEADDDYCEHLENKYGREKAKRIADELFQPSKGDPIKTWFEATREVVFRDLQLNDYIEGEKHIFGKNDAAEQYYEWLESKYADKANKKSRGNNQTEQEKQITQEIDDEEIENAIRHLFDTKF